MRVAFFVHTFPVISEQFVFTSAEALSQNGHDVDIIGLSNRLPDHTAMIDHESRASSVGQQNVHWPKSRAGRLAHAASAIPSVLYSHGPKAIELLTPPRERPWKIDLPSVFRARSIGDSGSYDILHCQFATLARPVLKLRRAGILKGQVIVHFRGYDISETIQRYGPHFYDDIWDSADYFIANCAFFKERLVSLGGPADRIEVVGTGIRLSDFPFRGVVPEEADRVRLIIIGRLVPRKGVHVALEALARLKSDGVNFILDVVGNGPQRCELEALTKRLGLTAEIRWNGASGHKEIAGKLADSDVFIAASMTPGNGGIDAPVNTIKEAMAVGVPVVATNHGGIPELVEDGVSGFLSRENDAHDLYLTLKRALNRRAEWHRIVPEARRRVEAEYDLGATTRKLEMIYDRARARRDDGLAKFEASAIT